MTETGLTAGGGTAPRYAQLRDVLQRRISEGRYAVGSLLPTESELCEEFGLSRHTVREAVRQLTEAGLVRRRQGSGTQVVAAEAEPHYVHAMRSLSELFQYAADTVFRIDEISDAKPEPPLSALFGTEGQEEWLRIEGVRLERDEKTPICFSRVFINRAFASIRDGLPDHHGAIYPLLEKRFGVSVADVEQEITAEPIGRAAARKMGVSSRLWAVRVVRRYLGGDGKLLIVSINHHPGDRFSYTMHLRRGGTKG